MIVQHGWRKGEPLEALISREWLVTNGLGGYASGTLSGVSTRRFHGKLIAALPAPLGRTMMLNHLEEHVRVGERSFRLGAEELVDTEVHFPQRDWLVEFHLEQGLPVWIYGSEGFLLEKRVLMPYFQNSTYILYRLLEAPDRVTLELTPSVRFRPHEGLLGGAWEERYAIETARGGWEIQGREGFPILRLAVYGGGASLRLMERMRQHWLYRLERSRGYESEGPLWSPGTLETVLVPGEQQALVASVEPWHDIAALTPEQAIEAESLRRARLLDRAHPDTRSPFGSQLVLAADQFIITPQSRPADVVRTRAAGDQPRTVIAGYHWFTDWGRDTMISLEGLTLVTGRYREAGSILRTFAGHVRDGLIPNLFPEGENEGLYHTADATMWFFHALDRFTEQTGDREIVTSLLPTLHDIMNHHLRGTRFGIGVDPADGLLRQGAEGYQLTWMDARVDGWVVTPRRGKAVEINALYYNALTLLERWSRQEGMTREADALGEHAARARHSFNERFWYPAGGYLYDVVEGEQGDDPSLRPNQILAISLPHPVLDTTRWKRVVDVVERELLTPVGLRTLSPHHPDYKNRYDGDLRARDAAYHQGTVWGWLIGPFIDAWIKTHPDDPAGARRFLQGFVPHLADACIGTLSEVFDAEEPFAPRGSAAQAWSVAEVLRCLSVTARAQQQPVPTEVGEVAA